MIPDTELQWHDFAWVAGVGRTEIRADGMARWSHRIWYVDDPPPFSSPMQIRSAYFPLWSLVLMAAVLPLMRASVALASLRRRHACRDKGCRICAYDLTGNTSGTCPECGAPTVNPHIASSRADVS
jgi:hypothetical protein